MIFFLFLSTLDQKCISPLNLPPPAVINGINATLEFVQIVTRHGARTPEKVYLPKALSGYWVCDDDKAVSSRVRASPVSKYRRFKQKIDPKFIDFYPNCRAGDLLLYGMAQHQKLGNLYHSYLYDNNIFFENPPNPKNIFVRSTYIERTFRSAEAFLYGAFPTQSPNEVIHVISGTSDSSIFNPSINYCQDWNRTFYEWEQTPQFHEWLDQSWNVISDFALFFNITEKSEPNLSSFCDYLVTAYCGGKPLPDFGDLNLTDFALQNLTDFCVNITAQHQYLPLNYNPMVGGSFAMRELIRVASGFINNSNEIRFALMSAHDSTVAALVNLVEGPQDDPVAFAAHFLMELWKDTSNKFWVRFCLNGRPLTLRLSGGESVIPFENFTNDYHDIYNYCPEFP